VLKRDVLEVLLVFLSGVLYKYQHTAFEKI